MVWSELLQPYVAVPLSATNLDEDSVIDTAQRVEIKLKDGDSQVRILHGFRKVEGEICYSIDNDLFTESKTGVHDTISKLDYLNGRAGRIFRWCITERLHVAMEPSKP